MWTLELKGLSNHDGDGNDNGKKPVGLYWQNNHFTRTSRLFVHFFAVTTRLRRDFHFLSLKFDTEFNSRKN